MKRTLSIPLTYEEFKHLEEQLKAWEEIEKTHKTTDEYYHKSLRLEITEELVFEFQGPLIKKPMVE